MKLNLFVFFLLISTALYGQIAETPEDISPLLVGEKVPNIKITSTEGDKISLFDIIEAQPTILLFYRGGWCPFCNVHLAAVGEKSEEINALGYQIVAISPDAPKKLNESIKEQALDYRLFSDASGALTQAMGLAHKAPDNYESMLSSYSDGENTSFLPAPALFILDTEGVILFEYISPNYKQRISSKMLMAVLGALEE